MKLLQKLKTVLEDDMFNTEIINEHELKVYDRDKTKHLITVKLIDSSNYEIKIEATTLVPLPSYGLTNITEYSILFDDLYSILKQKEH